MCLSDLQGGRVRDKRGPTQASAACTPGLSSELACPWRACWPADPRGQGFAGMCAGGRVPWPLVVHREGECGASGKTGVPAGSLHSCGELSCDGEQWTDVPASYKTKHQDTLVLGRKS